MVKRILMSISSVTAAGSGFLFYMAENSPEDAKTRIELWTSDLGLVVPDFLQEPKFLLALLVASLVVIGINAWIISRPADDEIKVNDFDRPGDGDNRKGFFNDASNKGSQTYNE